MNVFAELRGCEAELIVARAEIKRLQRLVDILCAATGHAYAGRDSKCFCGEHDVIESHK